MKNILVLEDDPANLQIFAALLWSKGYIVLEATTAQEALSAGSREQLLDLFVSDVLLKEAISGVQVALALAESRKGLPVLFVSGSPPEFWDESDRENLQLLTPECVAILEKPFLPADFEVAVERLVNPSSCTLSKSPAARQFSRTYPEWPRRRNGSGGRPI